MPAPGLTAPWPPVFGRPRPRGRRGTGLDRGGTGHTYGPADASARHSALGTMSGRRTPGFKGIDLSGLEYDPQFLAAIRLAVGTEGEA